MAATVEAFGEVDTTLNVMPTGTGKTVTFCHTVKRWCNGRRALIVAHRDELIRQACGKVRAILGLDPEVEMAEYRADEESFLGPCPVVVTSVQTQNSGAKPRMLRFRPDDFALLVIDEAHHATAVTYRKLIEHYRQNPLLKVLGVTATPDRADEAAMGTVFESCSFDYGISDAIDDGWLVPVTQQYVEVEGLDFSKVGTTAGDLNQADLDAVMRAEAVMHKVVSPTLEIVGARKALIFAVSVAQAERVCEIVNRHKPGSACFIHAGTEREERRVLLDDYRRGEYQFLVNVGIATEGFDCPSIEVVVMARPTKSRSLYAQMIGRGTRPLEECVPFLNDCTQPKSRRTIIGTSAKRDLLVLDFAGNSGKHKLVSSAEVLGGKFEDEVVDRATLRAKRATGPVDMAQELRKAAEELEDERRKKRRVVLAQARWSAKEVSPFDVFDLKPYRERGWHRERAPTPRMVALLEKCKIDKVEGLTMAQAGQVIAELKRRWNAGLCTYAQAKLLRKYGENPECTMAEASARIDAIKANGWKALPPRRPEVARAS